MKDVLRASSSFVLAGLIFLSLASSNLRAESFTFSQVVYPGNPGGITSLTGINDAGQAVGFAAIPYALFGCCASAAFIYSPGEFNVVFAPGPGNNLQTGGINNNGAFVVASGGTFYQVNGTTVTPVALPGSATEAGSINNLGQIVGSYYSSGNSYGFFFDGSTLQTLAFPGSLNTHVTGINDLGQIVGYSGTNGLYQGFLYQGGTYQTISVPGASVTLPLGINNAGEIVGEYSAAGPLFYADGFVDVGGVFSTFSGPAGYNTEIFGVNNLGQIAGTYRTPIGALMTGFIGTPVGTPEPPAPVPEPGTISLLGTGLVAVSGAALRRWVRFTRD